MKSWKAQYGRGNQMATHSMDKEPPENLRALGSEGGVSVRDEKRKRREQERLAYGQQ